jgi:hypothetical protein
MEIIMYDDLDRSEQLKDLEKAINTAFGWEGDDVGNTISGIKEYR